MIARNSQKYAKRYFGKYMRKRLIPVIAAALFLLTACLKLDDRRAYTDIYWFREATEQILVDRRSEAPVDTSVSVYRLRDYLYETNTVDYEVDTELSTAVEGVDYEMLSPVGEFAEPNLLVGKIPFRIFTETLTEEKTLALKLVYRHEGNREQDRRHDRIVIRLTPAFLSDVYSFSSAQQTIDIFKALLSPVDTAVYVFRADSMVYRTDKVAYEIDKEQSTAEEGVNYRMLTDSAVFAATDTLRGEIRFQVFPQTLSESKKIVMTLRYEHPLNREEDRQHDRTTITLRPVNAPDIYGFTEAEEQFRIDRAAQSPVDTSVRLFRLGDIAYESDTVGYAIDTERSTAVEGTNFEMLTPEGVFPTREAQTGSIRIRVFPQTLDKPKVLYLKLRYGHPANDEKDRTRDRMEIMFIPVGPKPDEPEP